MKRTLAVAAAALTWFSCGEKPQASAERQENQPLILGAEDVARVARGQVLTGALVSGELQARERATIRAQLAGSVFDVEAVEGQRVRKGQVLARIRAVAEREAVSSAEAAVRTAKTELEVAQREAERTEVLVNAGALAQRDLDQAQATVAGARARLAQAQAQLGTARERLNEAVVRAPISGVVSNAAVDSGDIVGIGAELFTIIDPSTLELQASVPAENITALKVGTPIQFSVQGYPGRTFRGVIRRISPAADPATKQVDVFASVPNNSGLLIAGLYASGRVATGDENALVIPAEALQSGETGRYVMKVEDGKVVRQEVRVGARDESTGHLQVLAGVSAGDTVLLGAATGVKPGTPVEIRRGEAN